MSQTTTAAESRRRGCPSFDSVWANLPEELSPTSAYHGESFVLEEDEDSFNVNNLCRNTFLHLDSSSPLARLSVHDLVRSFKEFSATMGAPAAEFQSPPPAGQKWPTNAAATPETTISSSNGTDDWPLLGEGPLAEFVNNYTFKASPNEEGDLLLLTPSPIVQSLLTKKDPTAPTPPTANASSNTPLNSESSPTVYREGHPLTCKPCAFFWSKGCLNGDNCQFCHLWHVPKRKKPMREQRNLMIIAKADGKITFLRCSIKDVIN